MSNKEEKIKVGDVLLIEQAFEDNAGEYHDEYAKVLSIDNKGFMTLQFPTEELTKFLEDAEYNVEDYKDCIVNEILFKPVKEENKIEGLEKKISVNKIKEQLIELETRKKEGWGLKLNDDDIACFISQLLADQEKDFKDKLERIKNIINNLKAQGLEEIDNKDTLSYRVKQMLEYRNIVLDELLEIINKEIK